MLADCLSRRRTIGSVDTVSEQEWTVGWWGDGWGVWPGEDPDRTTEPAYTTINITPAASDAAAHWALGVVPPHPRLRVHCPYEGDPDGEARFLARAARYRRHWWWGWWRR